MNRRDFLMSSGLLSLSFLVPGFQAWVAAPADAAPGTRKGATGRSGSASKTAGSTNGAAGSANSAAGTSSTTGGAGTADHKVVVVFLRGAADALSILVPYGDQRYYSMRKSTAIPKPGTELGAVDLDGYFGLHPNLAPLLPLWKNKTLGFVLNSGSPDPTRSHFDAQDYMESGCPGNKVVSTGWLNRLLAMLPNNGSPVRAINLGSTTPRILQGPQSIASFAPTPKRRRAAIDNKYIAAHFEQMYAGRNDSLGEAFLDGMEARATINEKLSEEMTAANQGAVLANRFGAFGRQLGKLIKEEPKVQVAFVGLGGFDTHVNQGAGKGQLANHLRVLGTGLSELVNGLGSSYDNTTVLVMSEFGRTVKENGNNGTDHGHGNVMWVLGGKVDGGKMYGRWDGLEQGRLFEGRDLPVTTDFRSVIASVVHEPLRLSQNQLATLFPNFNTTDRALLSMIRG